MTDALETSFASRWAGFLPQTADVNTNAATTDTGTTGTPATSTSSGFWNQLFNSLSNAGAGGNPAGMDIGSQISAGIQGFTVRGVVGIIGAIMLIFGIYTLTRSPAQNIDISGAWDKLRGKAAMPTGS
jgi:hypothetical protein